MDEERWTNPDDPQAIELSESELQELQRLEAKKTAVYQEDSWFQRPSILGDPHRSGSGRAGFAWRKNDKIKTDCFMVDLSQALNLTPDQI